MSIDYNSLSDVTGEIIQYEREIESLRRFIEAKQKVVKSLRETEDYLLQKLMTETIKAVENEK